MTDTNTKKVRVCVNNVWAGGAKFFNEDIVVLSAEEAAILIDNKRAKATRDSATVELSKDGKRVAL